MIQDQELLDAVIANLALYAESPTAEALRAEWSQMTTARRMTPGLVFDSRRHRDQRPIYIVRCDNGYHESLLGYEDALERLVDSHRTKAEDLEETHARYAAATGMSLADARYRCREMSKQGDVLAQIDDYERRRVRDLEDEDRERRRP
jgi:hypothetical protein